MSLDGKYVIGDGDAVMTEEDIGEPWRVQAYESLDNALYDVDVLNNRFARLTPGKDGLEKPRPYRVYQLKEIDD